MKVADIEQAISVIKDPFSERCMTDFDIFCDKDNIFGKGWTYRGHITFKNGDTEGKQSFKAESLQSLLLIMQKFVTEELKQKV